MCPQGGLYIWYRKAKVKSPSGQILAVLVFVIAIIFLFIAITINLGKISQVKTTTTVAAQGAAFNLASYIASFAYKISREVLGEKTSACNLNWFLIFDIILTFVLAIVFPPSALVGILIFGGLGALGSAYDFHIDVTNLNRSMAELTAEQRFLETSIGYALFASVNDPELVVDVNDYDEDGRTDDKYSRFASWYQHRLYWLGKENENLKRAVEDLLTDLNVFYSGSRIIRKFIGGDDPDYLWPAEPFGVFINLLADFEGKKNEPEHDIGVTYDFIPEESWDAYKTSQNVLDLKLKKPQDKTRKDNIYYDFSFWRDGLNADDENDPVNDEVDGFLCALWDFRKFCFGDYDPVENPTGEKGLLQFSADELVSSLQFWFPIVEDWIEERFYGWARAGGPLDNWRAQLLNPTLIERINHTIEDLGYQIENDKVKYFGGLNTILKEKEATLTDAEKGHLKSLITSLEGAIQKLKDIGRPGEFEYPQPYLKNLYFAATLFDYWQHGYNDMRNHWEDFAYVAHTIANPKFAQYTWTDSLGEHSVRVEVKVTVLEPKKGDSIVPTVESYCEFLCFSKCGDLKNYRGQVKVIVTREDNPTEEQSKVNLAQRLLWRFLHPVVKSEAVVGYDFGPDKIKLLRQISR